MTLRPEYSLGHSEYNAFLFAAVGEENVGTLTVLTALTRLGQVARRRLEGIRRRGDRCPSGRFAAAAQRPAHPFSGGWTRQR